MRNPSSRARVLVPADVDWEGFREWLGKDHAKRNVGDLLRNAKKYNDVLACLDWEWISVKPEVGEAYKLLRAVAEWVQRS